MHILLSLCIYMCTFHNVFVITGKHALVCIGAYGIGMSVFKDWLLNLQDNEFGPRACSVHSLCSVKRLETLSPRTLLPRSFCMLVWLLADLDNSRFCLRKINKN